MRKAKVYFNEFLAGYLYEQSRTEYVFEYDQAYFINVNMPAISVTLPKSQSVYKSNYLFPFFFNMLSEGANKDLQTRHLKIDENDAFGLLIKTAGFDTVGAVTVKEMKE